MDGGHDSETQALTASQEVAPSPLLQESLEEDLGAVREEEAAEPSITLKVRGLWQPKPWPGARPVSVWIRRWPSWCSFCW